jgi:hypothetical protein
VQERTARFNNLYMPLDTAAEFQKRKKRRKFRRGEDVEWFEKYRAGGIARVHRKMVRDDLKGVQ